MLRTLTTGADGGSSFTGGAGVDTFNGVVVGNNGTGTTLTAGDNLSGGTSIDKLSVSVSGSAGAATTISGVTLNAIERVEVSNFDTDTTQGDTHTFDMSGATGVSTVALTASNDNGDTYFANLKNIVDAEMTGGGADLSVAYGSGVTLTGTSDTQKVTVNGVTSAASFIIGTNGFENLAITATGANSTLSALTLGTPTSGTQTMTVTGDKNLTISSTLASTVKTVDASAFTGALAIGLDTTLATSVIGGTGNDVLTYTTGLDSSDTIDGGAGTDVLSVTSSISSSLANIKNIEILRVGGTNQSYDTSKIVGLTSFQIADAADQVTLSSLGTSSSLAIVGNVGATGGNNVLSATATNGTVNLTLDNSTKKDADGIDVAPTDLTNVSTLNLISSGGNLSATKSVVNSNNIVLGTTSSLTKITVAGDTDLVIEGSTGTVNNSTVSALNSTIKTVDASTLTGRLYVVASSSASTITGGAGNDSITGGSANDVIVGGAGNDTIASGGGDDNISGGDGNDSVSLGAASAATKVVTVDGGAGNDTVTLTSATGYFNLAGGEGDDSFVVAGATSLYFDGNDTLAGGNGTDTLTFAGTNGAAYDLAANSANLQNVSGFEAVKLDVSGLTGAGHTMSFTFNDVLASSIGSGTLTLSAVDAATPAASATAVVTVDASGVLLSSTKVNFTGSAAVQYVYNVGAALENVTLNSGADTVKVSNIGFLNASDTVAAGSGSDTLTLNYGATSSTAVTFDTSKMTGVSGFETINLDGVTGIGTGAITATITDAFALANNDISSNTLTVSRSQLGSATTDDTGNTKIDGSAVTSVKLSLSGAAGNDTIIGGAANDTITGGNGTDSLTGGAGNDTFVFSNVKTGIATITDINFGTSTTQVDIINVAGGTWQSGSNIATQSGTGTWANAKVLILDSAAYADLTAVDNVVKTGGTKAQTGTNQALIIWQDTLGNVNLSVDADGATSGGITTIAKFSGVTITGIVSALDYSDFSLT